MLAAAANFSLRVGSVGLLLGRFVGGWRGSQVVRQGSAKALCVGSIPTSASNSKYRLDKELQISQPSSASKSASRFVTRNYSTTTPRSPRHDLLKRNWPCVWCH